MDKATIALTLTTLLCNALCAHTADGPVALSVTQHQPCSYSAATGRSDPSEILQLATSAEAPLRRDAASAHCYFIRGKVRVRRAINSDVPVYAEMFGEEPAPLRCYGADERTGCGGFGSCHYCGACRAWALRNAAGASIELWARGGQLACGTTVPAGEHDNMAVRVCMPSKRNLLKHLVSRGVTRTALDHLATLDSNVTRIAIDMRMFFFDWPIDRLVAEQNYLADIVSNNGREPIEKATYENLPLSRHLYKGERPGPAGCHRLVGYARMQLDDDDWREAYAANGLLTSAARPPPADSLTRRHEVLRELERTGATESGGKKAGGQLDAGLRREIISRINRPVAQKDLARRVHALLQRGGGGDHVN